MAVAVAGLLAAGCGPGPRGGSATAASPAAPARATGDCDSVTTCYTPRQLQVAYGIKPLLDRGFDGRGETAVLPELAETQLNPPSVTDLCQDIAGFDDLFHLPAARIRVVTTLAGADSPWLAFGEEVLEPYGNTGGAFQASGGGFSHLFARPAYQAGVPGTGATRGVPDVSADANGHTGMAIVLSNAFHDITMGDNTVQFPPTTITGYQA
jgi:subtilase family serine protease